MAEAASAGDEIFALISEEDKKSIPDVLAKKLDELWETKVKEITALKIESEKQKITGGEWGSETREHTATSSNLYVRILVIQISPTSDAALDFGLILEVADIMNSITREGEGM